MNILSSSFIPKSKIKIVKPTQIAKKVLIKLGYTCNNNCMFCHSYNLRIHKDLSIEQIKEKIKYAKQLDIDMIVLSGGEPTIRRDFFHILRIIKFWGMKIGIVTNGRMFAYNSFLETVTKFPVEYIYISLHSASPRLHNTQVRANAFEETFQGIKNLSKTQIFQTVNVVINKNNFKELEKIVELLKPFNLRIKFSLLEPKGMALTNFETLSLNPQLVADKITKIMNTYQRNPGNAAIGCDAFTPCLIKNYDRVKIDLFTDNFFYMCESNEDDFFEIDYGKRAFAEDCLECVMKPNCQGIYQEYLSIYKNFLTPFLKGKSNSFFYTPVSQLQKCNVGTSSFRILRSHECPINFNFTNYDAKREIILKNNDKFELYRTETKDFSEDELLNIKSTGQIYLNLTNKVRNIDYGQDLRKVILSDICKFCKNKNLCPSVFEISIENFFENFETTVKEEISKMQGRVCDIGCGNIRYFDALKKLIDRKIIEYTCIEPKKISIKDIRIKHFKTEIEEFNCPPDYFDNILILRSYSHFKSLHKAFDVINKILKPKGKILIVENTPFGLIRKKKNNLPYKTKPQFEHFRNHILQDAINFLKSYNFKVLKQTDVAPNRCNQWFVILEKI